MRKDAKKSLQARQVAMMDAFPRSIWAVSFRCRAGSHRSNNTKSFFTRMPVYLPKTDRVCWCGGCVKRNDNRRNKLCVLNSPASDEQSVLDLGHQLKVEAVLRLVARELSSEHGVPPSN